MSAWPQAVWVIKQLKRQVQKDFETNSNIEEYREQLGKWNTELETQKNNLTGLQDRLDNLESNVIDPIVAYSNQGQPEGQSDIQSGTIWFVLEDQEASEDQGNSGDEGDSDQEDNTEDGE